MRLTTLVAAILASLVAASAAQAQVATFSGFDDAAAGCYQPTGTAPDPANPNRLLIAMAACTASAPNGSAIVTDSFDVLVTAPAGYFVSRVTFSQSGSTSGSRGGMGFKSAMWNIDTTPASVSGATGGWLGTADLSLLRKTSVSVSVSTFLAAFGIQVVSGSATASNPSLLVELAPLQ